MTEGAGQSAVLLCVPEAEPIVHAWRSTGDPSAARGVPAHVTLLTPFLPPAEIDEGVLGELTWFFGGVDAFRVRFSAVGCFDDEGVVFLEPDGATLDQLAQALALRWPETPPYAGRHEHPHAHLTVVHTPDGELRSRAGAAVEQRLPLEVLVAHAALWVCDAAGHWSEQATFPFGEPEQ